MSSFAAILTFPHEWNILERDVKQQTKQTYDTTGHELLILDIICLAINYHLVMKSQYILYSTILL